MAEHDAAIERLILALESVRGDLPEEESPPGTTGLFVVGGIEACVCDVLAAGEVQRIWDTLPELMHLVAGSYLGKEEADEAYEEAQALLERKRAELEGDRR